MYASFLDKENNRKIESIVFINKCKISLNLIEIVNTSIVVFSPSYP